MTDHELLELAAKAAGMDSHYSEWAEYIKDHDSPHYTMCAMHRPGIGGQADSWNPLIDDRDALRLLASLRMGIEHNLPCDDDLWVVVSSDTCKDLAWEEFEAETDRISATRRAIVRAAAEIGKAIEEGK